MTTPCRWNSRRLELDHKRVGAILLDDVGVTRLP